MQGEPQALKAERPKKSCHGQTPINECSTFDHPSNLKGPQPIPHAISPQMAPHHTHPEAISPAPTKKPRQNATETETAPPSPGIQRAAHQTTPQCPAHPPQCPPQTNTYINEPPETPPKPSTKTAQTHPITRTTSI